MPESVSTLAQHACANTARTGTRVRGDSVPRLRKNRPSRAIAKGTREFASTLACNELSEDTMSAAAMNVTATGPAKVLMASAATEDVGETEAICVGDSTQK